MNKVELVEAVQKQLGSETSKAEAERAVTAVINAVKVGVKKDKMVQLVGFGTFKVVERKAARLLVSTARPDSGMATSRRVAAQFPPAAGPAGDADRDATGPRDGDGAPARRSAASGSR